MEQLTLQLMDEKPSVPIPKELQAQLIELIAQAIVAVVKNKEGNNYVDHAGEL